MNIPRCPLPVWKKLYDAADAFREIACWEWMSDTDLFGVQNPESGEIGYCCVLGEFGEVFGLVVYLGSLGLEQHHRIQSGKLHPGSLDFRYSQCCLTAWFGSRSDLDKTDLKMIRALNRNFTGRNSWPQYRSMQPGYLPWYPAEGEANFLALCLEQSRQVALLFAKEPEYLKAPSNNVCLVRVPAEDLSPTVDGSSFERPGAQAMLFPDAVETRSYRWKSQWLNPAPIVAAPVKPFAIDEIRMQRIKKNCAARAGAWQIDGFYTPTPVQGDDRPFFPYVYLCADHDSGLILSTLMAEPSRWMNDFPHAFLDSAEQQKLLPRKLYMRKKELRELFSPLAAQLGIEIEMTRKLPAFDRAKRGLLKFVDDQS